MRSTTGRGFSLIELMIVCAIVAVLAAIAQTAYDAYASLARKEQAVAAPVECPPAAPDAAGGAVAAATPPSLPAQGPDGGCDGATRRIQDGVAPTDIEIPARGGKSALERNALPPAPGSAATSG